MRNFWLVVLLPLFALMAGCAQTATRMDIQGIEKSSAVTLTDLRPDTEKQSTIFSYLISSSAYGIYRRGDETLDPPITQVLRHRIFEKFGSTGGKLDLKIHHMVVYINAKSALRSQAIGGIIGAVIAANSSVNISQTVVDRAQFEASAEDEYKRAFYTDQENPQNASVFVIYIDAEINGQRVFVKTMAPTTASKDQNPHILAVDGAIQYYLSKY